MIEYWDDVVSDLSRFHRIDDPLQLDSPRFFKLAERLVYYEGAIRTIVQVEQSGRDAPNAQVSATSQPVLELETVLGQTDTFGHGPADIIDLGG